MMWKICPFCGSENTIFINGVLDGIDYLRVACCACNAEGPLGGTKDEALRLWNTRRRKARKDGE